MEVLALNTARKVHILQAAILVLLVDALVCIRSSVDNGMDAMDAEV